jgi:hypothetical protein
VAWGGSTVPVGAVVTDYESGAILFGGRSRMYEATAPPGELANSLRLRYLGRDPYGGAVGLHEPTVHLQRVPLRVEGPRDDAVGLLAAGMHVAFYLDRRPDGHVVRTHSERAPEIVAAAERLRAVEAGAAARAGASFSDLLPQLLDQVGM